jgi:hypothetical protein
MTGEVELIPGRVLFGNPEEAKPRLSPDGTRLAWIAPHRGVLNVWVAPVTAADGIDRAAALPPYWAPEIARFHRRVATRKRTPSSCGPGRRCRGSAISGSRC